MPAAEAEQHVEHEQARDDRLISERNEPARREAHHERPEQWIRDKRRRQRADEQPAELGRRGAGGDGIAQRTQHEPARQRAEEEDGRCEHRAHLVRLDIDDAAQQRMQNAGFRGNRRRCVVQGAVFCFACHAASTSVSFEAGIPATAPSSIAFCSWGGRVLCQSSVSFAVTASGRNVNPFASALALLRRENPAVGPSGGSHTGMCRQPLMPVALRKSAGTQVNSAPAVVTALMPASISISESGVAGPVALYVPNARVSAIRIIHSARSRESMNCTGSVGLPGAITSPPLSIRTGQYVKRSDLSSGPTMRPGRMIVLIAGYCFSTSFSDWVFSAP